VTVLFADAVHSMDIAATVGPERLWEIMADLSPTCVPPCNEPSPS
jgi:adenylate cyclase